MFKLYYTGSVVLSPCTLLFWLLSLTLDVYPIATSSYFAIDVRISLASMLLANLRRPPRRQGTCTVFASGASNRTRFLRATGKGTRQTLSLTAIIHI